MIKETNIMLDLNTMPVLTLELAINYVVNDMINSYLNGGSFYLPTEAARIAAIYGANHDFVSSEIAKRFDACIEANVTRL
jgi:hypothetical protein